MARPVSIVNIEILTFKSLSESVFLAHGGGVGASRDVYMNTTSVCCVVM